MRSVGVSLLFVLLTVVGSGCTRLGASGEACTTPGLGESDFVTDMGGQCGDGLVCAPNRSATADYSTFDTASCRELCTSASDCPDGFTCRGVSGAEYRQACLPVAAD